MLQVLRLPMHDQAAMVQGPRARAFCRELSLLTVRARKCLIFRRHEPDVGYGLAAGLGLGGVEVGAEQRHRQAAQQPRHPQLRVPLRRCCRACSHRLPICRAWKSMLLVDKKGERDHPHLSHVLMLRVPSQDEGKSTDAGTTAQIESAMLYTDRRPHPSPSGARGRRWCAAAAAPVQPSAARAGALSPAPQRPLAAPAAWPHPPAAPSLSHDSSILLTIVSFWLVCLSNMAAKTGRQQC